MMLCFVDKNMALLFTFSVMHIHTLNDCVLHIYIYIHIMYSLQKLAVYIIHQTQETICLIVCIQFRIPSLNKEVIWLNINPEKNLSTQFSHVCVCVFRAHTHIHTDINVCTVQLQPYQQLTLCGKEGGKSWICVQRTACFVRETLQKRCVYPLSWQAAKNTQLTQLMPGFKFFLSNFIYMYIFCRSFYFLHDFVGEDLTDWKW